MVREFKASGQKDCIVEFELPKRDRYYLEDYPEIRDQKLRCRLVSVDLENGEKEILCTSLTDSSIYLYISVRPRHIDYDFSTVYVC